jgi:small-conductance mechanosensitive channel
VQGTSIGVEVADLAAHNREAWIAAGKVAAAVLIGLAVHSIAFRLLAHFAHKTTSRLDDVLVARLRRSMRLSVVLLALQVVLPTIEVFAAERASVVRHVVHLLTIVSVTWLVLALLRGIEQYVEDDYDTAQSDNLEARRVRTQIEVVARVGYVFVIVIAVAAGLMTFPRVREFGASLLASAGIVGLIVGLAARPVLENLFAGLQIALTQPIRIDDVVIVEGEWGRIEEITTTYVVIRVWDQRRLIVPFSTFIQSPFQNWTRQSADILGTVFLYADYSVPVEALRVELTRIVEASGDWDRKVCLLQVTDASERAMQLRALVSAADSSRAWDLRVHVREKLIAFLQREYPQALPHARIELRELAARDDGSATLR